MIFMREIISGRVKCSYLSFITGKVLIGGEKVLIGNLINMFVLKNSKWARVLAVDDYHSKLVVRILEAR